MIRQTICLVFFLLAFACGWAQYAPPAGQPGSTAIAADNERILGWATRCEVQRGLQQINNPESGPATVGEPAFALGPEDGKIVSLGDGGIATLFFEKPIRNGPGFDFLVFENAFLEDFLELAFVEVSSDGERFFRFPAFSNTDTLQQVDGFGRLDASRLHNLAGKYMRGFGTPFDLDCLAGIAGLDVNHIVAVRIIDVVGTIHHSFSSRDSRGYIVNDPWPTPFASGGFDLDAVGVIHYANEVAMKWFFNPEFREFEVQGLNRNAEFTLLNFEGKVLANAQIESSSFRYQLPKLPKGHYVAVIVDRKRKYTHKFAFM